MTGKEVIKKLRAEGWTFSAGGRHMIATSPDGKKRVPIPVHGPRDISIGTLKAIEKQTGVSMTGRG